MTLYVLDEVYPIVAGAAAAVAPEIMVSPVPSFDVVAEKNWDVLAVGPGLGAGSAADLLELVRSDPRPMVLDADLLNAIASAGPETVIKDSAGDRLLSPHPGEMGRLWSDHPPDRRETAELFTKQFPVCLLLKGSRSVIAERGHKTAFNPTGQPGMATGGMGDVLTGLCAALLAQRCGLREAAMMGSWLLGRGAEIAVSRGERSVESTTAGDVIEQLGRAFDDLRRGCY